jgi:hypothetical protein
MTSKFEALRAPATILCSIPNGFPDAPSEPLFRLAIAWKFPKMSFCQAKGLVIVTFPICCPS